ncbi:hypothetical protein RA28_11430 [Ruegeria sp. ANG-S4]|uniref:MotE family protein n=1 Tax=Ruegeria sp. ANG-S4 TaxID=1577904 RepID=UPI0005809A39|nr:hypothetical protein [Ruegeria sp. ANG-S4]KIC45092.1 hypothetical protein RA28_11430 [Ruegeria sp. ANG-S4]
MSKVGSKSMARPRGGVLTVISLLMIGSATLRLGFEAGPALACNTEPAQESLPEKGSNLEDLGILLAELLRREEDLNQREQAVQDMENALEIAKTALDSQLVALQEAEAALQDTLMIAEKSAESDLTQLTDVYQNMKPKDASALFETMDPVFAAGFLSRMPPDAAASVMAGLSPETAYTISVVMAGRNARAPKE